MGILLLLATLFHYFDNLNEMSEFPVGRELSVKLVQAEIEILNSPMLNQNIEFILKKNLATKHTASHFTGELYQYLRKNIYQS